MLTFRGLTIDPEGAQDLDDAFLVRRDGEGWVVQVAIPDCRNAIPHGSGADLAAREAGTTAYSARGVRRHMLPVPAVRELSLIEEAPKPVLLVTVPVSADLRAGRPEVVAGTFESIARMTYGQANAVLADARHILNEPLVVADALARGLERRRASSQAVGLRTLSDGYVTDEEGRIARGVGHGAERIVREMMILTNAALAGLCAEEGLRILYRNHRAQPTASRASLLEDIGIVAAGSGSLDTLAQRLNLVVGRARLSPFVEGHWGLNLPGYAWFTSPIRRYADLVNQRLLFAHVEGTPAPDIDLEALAAHLNALNDAERDGTADWHKSQADQAAAALMRRGGAAQASTSEFTGMLRTTAAAAKVPDALVDESLARLADGRLTPKDIARLLDASPAIAARVVLALARRPNEATTVLTFLSQSGRGTLPAYVETPSGLDHLRTFVARGTVEIDGKRHDTPPVAGGSLKEARQRAGVVLLALAYGVEPPVFEAPASKAPAVAPQAVTASAAGANEANPRNRLQEICQKRRWPMPRFEVTQTGPSHAPDFEATVSLDVKGAARRAGPCKGRSRKEAEMAASAALLATL